MSYLNDKEKNCLIRTFTELVKIPSLSYKEGKFARYLVKILKNLGCKVYVDNAGKKIGGDTGNIIARFPGTIKSKPILLCAHLDTVKPGMGIKPVVKKDRIISDGKTILAADCKASIAIILETLRILKRQKLKHPPVEIVLTIAEEMGLLGSKNLDYKKLKSKHGITLDSDKLGFLYTKSPEAVITEINIKGKESHSGMAPEKGISAIEVAAKAISALKLGRIDKETICNINMMQAGTAVNTIAPNALLKGDIRSYSPLKLKRQIKLIKTAFAKACKASAKKIDGRKITPKFSVKIIPVMSRLDVPKNSLVVKLLKNTCRKNKVNLKLASTAGGSDANILSGYKILAPNMGIGARKVHTTGEHLILDEFFKTAEIVMDTVCSFRK
jgi:tripeptide aminopeptidase